MHLGRLHENLSMGNRLGAPQLILAIALRVRGNSYFPFRAASRYYAAMDTTWSGLVLAKRSNWRASLTCYFSTSYASMETETLPPKLTSLTFPGDVD
jgi:hypothetical protein